MAISKIEFNFAQYNDGSEAGPTYDTFTVGKEAGEYGIVNRIEGGFYGEKKIHRVYTSSGTVLDIFNANFLERRPTVIIRKREYVARPLDNKHTISIQVYYYNAMLEHCLLEKGYLVADNEVFGEFNNKHISKDLQNKLRTFEGVEDYIEAIKEYYSNCLIVEK